MERFAGGLAVAHRNQKFCRIIAFTRGRYRPASRSRAPGMTEKDGRPGTGTAGNSKCFHSFVFALIR